MIDDFEAFSDYEFPKTLCGLELQRTCFACPEQYDVYRGDTQVAYFRLRHGRFYAAVPDVGGTVVYESYPEGDGVFCDSERLPELTKACEAVVRYLDWGNAKPREFLKPPEPDSQHCLRDGSGIITVDYVYLNTVYYHRDAHDYETHINDFFQLYIPYETTQRT